MLCVTEKGELLETTGREGPSEKRGRLLAFEQRQKRQGRGESCTQGGWACLYERKICPMDNTKVEGWEGTLSVPGPKEKKWQRRDKDHCQQHWYLPKSLEVQTHVGLQHPQGVTMDISVLRQQRDCHTSLGLGR